MTETRTIGEIMRDIASADVGRGVFRVSLVAEFHRSGFDAVIDMRGDQAGGFVGISHHADTPMDALIGAEASLLARFGRCPACGEYREART